jgi:F-type H+-transporting ATPase subunit a
MPTEVHLDPFEHVVDHGQLEVYTYHVNLPTLSLPVLGEFQITKFMVLELVAALLCVAVFVPLARHVKRNPSARGAFANLFEAMVVFLRDEVARIGIGHDGDRFVPFLATVFMFILFCNLLGMIPFGGSPTSNITVTAAMALVSFAAIHGSGIKKMGPFGYLHAMVPPVPRAVWPLVLFSELIGHVTKTLALAIRLFANMFAGHMVLFVILSLIVLFKAISGSTLVSLGTAVPSVALVVALSLLELFVAFLQAYIFTFLTALFIGMAVHPHH